MAARSVNLLYGAALAATVGLAAACGDDGDAPASAPREIAAAVQAPPGSTYVSESRIDTDGYYQRYTIDEAPDAWLDTYVTTLEIAGWTIDSRSPDALHASEDEAWLDVVIVDDEQADIMFVDVCSWNAEPAVDACASFPGSLSEIPETSSSTTTSS